MNLRHLATKTCDKLTTKLMTLVHSLLCTSRGCGNRPSNRLSSRPSSFIDPGDWYRRNGQKRFDANLGGITPPHVSGKLLQSCTGRRVGRAHTTRFSEQPDPTLPIDRHRSAMAATQYREIEAEFVFEKRRVDSQ